MALTVEETRAKCRVRAAKYRAEHLEEVRAYQRQYKRDHRVRIRLRDNAYVESNPDMVRSKLLKSRYGITLEQYNAMLLAQNGVCAICKKAEVVPVPRYPDQIKNLAVDHCHSTGKVRGLLCQGCNVSIARFSEDPALLQSAVAYLERHKQ